MKEGFLRSHDCGAITHKNAKKVALLKESEEEEY